MSEFINNHELRKQTLTNIIRQLHEGKSVDEVKRQFEEVFGGVSATEISEVEGALIAEGLEVQEVQRLCDVHASVFKGSIEEIHRPHDPGDIPGHPVQILKLENRELEKRIQHVKDSIQQSETIDIARVRAGIEELLKIGVHYKKKENLLFPFMEKYGITAPPKVMWGVDDEIRTGLREIKEVFSGEITEMSEAVTKLQEVLQKTEEMIFKEENIMIPMLLEVMKEEDWLLVSEGSSEIGFLIEQIPVWKPMIKEGVASKMNKNPSYEMGLTSTNDDGTIASESGKVQLPSGAMSVEELTCMLNSLPLDITFVDKDDVVKYFSEGKERAFPRTRAIIGRNVSNCHPPTSVHVVEQIVSDFKEGKKDQEDFWIKAGDKYILIRYYAVRNGQGEYLGVLEVTQDIKPIQEITGEKRLLS